MVNDASHGFNALGRGKPALERLAASVAPRLTKALDRSGIQDQITLSMSHPQRIPRKGAIVLVERHMPERTGCVNGFTVPWVAAAHAKAAPQAPLTAAATAPGVPSWTSG